MISGEMHYARIPKQAWRDRMKMAKSMGLNTIGTYIFWNLHEPEKGVFDFSGDHDIVDFVTTAKEEGLWVILRPSPYVCAEWEYGGYPYWLQSEKGLVVRSRNSKYLKEYRKYINEIGKRLAPLQIKNGGNILMIQLENEYGSYGNDKEYLKINQKMFIAAGFDGLLYTCDPAADVEKGYLPGLLPAINGLDKPNEVKALVNKLHNGKGPYYIAEWYPAWFDWWGTPHHIVPPGDYANRLDSVLKNGISINMYMFHGGTTRGFMNGANLKDDTNFEPQISSYDYDAPLDEAGNPTEKYFAFRKVIQKHLPAGVSLPEVPKRKPAVAIPGIMISKEISILDNLPKAIKSRNPKRFEELGQDFGYVLYRKKILKTGSGTLLIKGLRDYAVIILNGKTIATLDRRLKTDSLSINLSAGINTLDILVENMGRINFGKYMLDNNKGILESVSFNKTPLINWEMFKLPFKKIGDIKSNAHNEKIFSPKLSSGKFTLEKAADTYLDMRNWGKGVVWVNGHNLGKYWSIGPQQTIYLPKEWLQEGENKIMIFEMLGNNQNLINGLEKPILNLLQ
ncbi:beta-galactosidase [Pedobacter sp. MC2016-05]|nr:beta-galactosidase family protein [Pedobacter sp. MC2016-05]MCX2475321.1 beta-galactosidase [Pedobacter sp. MC2016-05]